MGFDETRFEERPGDEFKCALCHDILENPVECAKCQYSFCQECINKWTLEHPLACPFRCELKLQACHRQFKNIYLRLRIRCVYARNGCTEVVTLENVRKHESGDCEYREIVCTNEGCGEKEIAKNAGRHEEVCQWKRVSCGKCGFSYFRKDQDGHDCLQMLIHGIEAINTANSDLEKKIQALEEASGESVLVKSLAKSNLQLHLGITCSQCQQSPISGKRFTCLQCPSYDLCEICRDRSQHEHDQFIELSSSACHEGVRCDGCDVKPMKGLRYKCKMCPDFDFCHKCRVSRSHPHTEFYMWQPFWVAIVPLPDVKKYYQPGEILIRSWLLINLSREVIDSPAINCVGGEPGCRHTLFQFKFRLEMNQTGLVKLSEPIIDTLAPGDYSSDWVLSTLDRGSFFGPKLTYSFSII